VPVENLRDIFQSAVDTLRKVGIENPAEDVKILLAAVLGIKRQEVPLCLSKSMGLTENQQNTFADYIKQRAERKPVSRILGNRGFWTLDFILNEDTLDPRPDSESLVDAVLRNTKKEDCFTILDLGTGTGCLPLAVLAERPAARAVGVDIAAGAVQAAVLNAEKNGMGDRADFVCADWNDFAANTKEKFDIVISNPPYIPYEDIAFLEDEVKKYDPLRALDGGEDGLDCYRQIAKILPLLLKENGCFFCEIGMGQAKPVSDIFENNGMKVKQLYKDLAGIERVLFMKNK